MREQQVLIELTEVFRKVLDDDNIKLKLETTADNIKDWDSLTNIQLIVAIEKRFGIRFSSGEIYRFKNVGQICDAIIKKSA